jgi:hypothetical protein
MSTAVSVPHGGFTQGGVTGLRCKRVYSLEEWNPRSAFEGFSEI